MSRSANDEQSATDPGWARARNQLFGMIMEGRSFSGRERNCCFLNTRHERFATISALSGLDFPDDGRCIAVTDWDRDGDQDMWISNRNAPRLLFMRNDSPSQNHFISMRLVGNGTTTNRDAIGARVEVVLESEADGPNQHRMIRTLRAGEGFLSQSSKWLHFGLGSANSVIRVIVHWPGDKPQTFVGLRFDQRYRLEQGQVDPQLVDVIGSSDSLRVADTKLPADTRAARVVLSTRVPMPSIEYASTDGQHVTESFETGTPTLVNLWASWCRPCVKELSDFVSDQQRLADKNLRIISLSVDQIGPEPTPPEDVHALLLNIGYPYSSGNLDVDQLEHLQQLHDQFFFLRRPLPLPSSFLIDSQGRLSVIYRGPLLVDQLLSDAGLLHGGYQDNMGQAACIPGRALSHQRVQQVAQRADRITRYRVAAWLSERGHSADALEHFGVMARDDPTWALPQRHLAQLHLDENRLDQAARFASRALQLDSENAEAHNTIGLIRSRQGDPKAAESHFRQSVKLDNQFAGGYNNLGIVLAMQGKITDAGRCFHLAVEIDDEFAEAHANLGNVHAARGDAERAIRHYHRAIEIDPKNVDPYNNLGTMFGRLGRIDQAIEYYRQALTIDPKNQEARRNLDRAQKLLRSRASGAAN